jgi:DNA-binding LytR/AlgR family response regulator
MKTLIIEDELPAARQLTRLLQQFEPDAEVLDVLDSVEGAVRWLRTFPAPQLIFMDIQIADGLSFDIFRQVELHSPVIFTTAFDQYAVQAFKVNALDYLLKPVDPDELQRALIKVQSAQPRGADLQSAFDNLARLFRRDSYKERFLVKTGHQLAFVPADDIAFFRSSDGLTQAHTFSGKKYFVEHTLEELERLLDPRDYFRISRSMTLRLNSIQKITPHFNGRLKLDVQPTVGDEVFVSRERSGEFKAWLGG